ncbi:Major facilitator superfamily domain general substrate transporter [Penicillium cf. griseofulvum]|uniref:Major facilitator superfamily domain general substrate transporter n=1 Tax=Penicillium cf. griseofulvum TaxID=2972120 RepID=A0A9W9M4F3_9EURO|nr:Major facilitator superfamily domain general substrate transporter [Penicillium cf. griseofulvum]KAJ5434283.1 Major facilitator superfamily domain general substrate transporter [Penicillium cf. griseofulvum]KAJ5452114.1 Major facilitator superfamily domain general substrate transporter [Penicillium cf. griseofulvum]
MESTANASHNHLSDQEGEKTLTGDIAAEEKVLVQPAAAELNAQHPPVDPTTSEGTEHLTGPKLALITLALCLGVFLVALDNSIIATAIPKITSQFYSLDDVGWYGSAYLLTTAALQLLFGKFYTIFNVKWTYLIAIGVFELGSLICGVGNNSLALIMGRAVAGIGSAGIFSGSLIMVAHSVALEKRPLYNGLIGGMFGISSVAGPLLGGAFTDKVSWRWCFYINLPIGAVTVLVIGFFFPAPNHHIKETTWMERIKKFDPMGTSLFLPAIICLLLALQWGGTIYAWNSWRIIVLFCFFAVLIVLFLFVQYTQQDNATVPPRIFFRRTICFSALYSFCLGAAFLSSVYFLPIWFQAVKNASPVSSGIMNLPMLISVVLTSIVSGIVITIVGYYTPFMIFGTVLLAIGYGLMSMFHLDTSKAIWIGYQILAGIGVGAGMQQSMIAVQVVLDLDDIPTGTTIIVFAQTLGGALFVSIGNNVFRNKLVEYLTLYMPNLDPGVILKTGATGLHSVVDKADLPGVLLAYNDALTQTFIVSAAVASISIIGALGVEWKSVKGKNLGPGGAA